MNFDELSAYLGATTAAELFAWAQRTDRVVRVPAHGWHARGFTGARLAKIYVSDAEHGTQAVILKVLPPGEDAEAAAHRRAVRQAPAAFRHHFVGQVYDSAPMADGGTLTFQQPAGYSAGWRPLSDLPAAATPAACATVTRSLIAEWNPDLGLAREDVVAVLRREIADYPWVVRQLGDPSMATAAWVRVDGDLVPNPLALLGPRSALTGMTMDLAVGRTHGDLHGRNVLIRQTHGVAEPGSFFLIDLMTYAMEDQIGRDVVRLLLSVTEPLVRELPENERRLLLPVFVRPELAESAAVGPAVVDTLVAIHGTARMALRRYGEEVWRDQYLLSLVTQGLAMASFVKLGADVRCWFFQLAGHAAQALRMELGAPVDPSNDDLELELPTLRAPDAVGPDTAGQHVVGRTRPDLDRRSGILARVAAPSE